MALEFNGSTQSIQVTDDASLKGFSAMSLCWRSYAASYNNDGFITKINDAADIRDYTTLRGGGYPRLYIGNGSNVWINTTIASEALPTNVWVDVVCTYDGSTGKIYYNAVDKTNTSTGAGGNVGSGNTPVKIGYHPTYYFTGKLQDARIYNRVLSIAEIQIIHNAVGSDNIINGLVGRWLMNEKHSGSTATVSSSIIDLSSQGNHGDPINSPVYRESPLKLKKVIAVNVLSLITDTIDLLCQTTVLKPDYKDLVNRLKVLIKSSNNLVSSTIVIYSTVKNSIEYRVIVLKETNTVLGGYLTIVGKAANNIVWVEASKVVSTWPAVSANSSAWTQVPLNTSSWLKV